MPSPLSSVLFVLSYLIVGHYSRTTTYDIQTIRRTDPRVKYSFIEAKEELAHNEHCDTYRHYIPFKSHDENCVRSYPVKSCDGQCVSESHPKFFFEKMDVPSRHNDIQLSYNVNCRCCVMVSSRTHNVEIKLLCNNGSTVKERFPVTFARECECKGCENENV